MRKMRIITLLTALIMVGIHVALGLIGFGEEKKIHSVKVGFVYDGDESAPYTYNFVKVQRKLATEDFGARVTTVAKTNIPESEGKEAIQELIDEDCDIIFTCSYGYENVAKQMAKDNPKVQFCQATGDNANDEPLPNYHTFMGEIYQGRYVSGIIAGMKLKEMIDTGVINEEDAKLGYVGAFPYAEVISGYTAFILGVRSIVPTATMDVRYTNTWSSYALEKACARQLIEDGCVIISQHSDTIGPAVACEEAKEQGMDVYHVGYNQSMIDIAPTTSLVSCRIDWSVYIFAAVNAVMNDEIIEKSIEGNIHGNDVGAGFDCGWVSMLDINNLIAAEGTEEAVNAEIDSFKKKQKVVFKGDYTGINPDDESDTINLKKGYIENKNASAPSFHYILKDIVNIKE
ncbi:MAG: BMP family ABC transporter substrate-binding protein [Lachnospiraceae bacterium]|nr:BMP family ABC transporter substrate-binding protein [Lachnospiraceae bacterium]